jgi:predicted site-specific integrase-resolvase
MANTELIRPEALANELGVSGKLVRAYLRKNFTRTPEAKNTAWVLTGDQAKNVREHFIARRAVAKNA